MKRYVLMMCALLMVTLSAFAAEPMLAAQTAGEVSGVSEIVIDLGSFTGIVACISMVVTQILKVVPSISESKLAKIGISCGVGMVICILAWLLQLTPILAGYQWWGVLIYGLAAGLSGCGFYDVIKAIAGLFKEEEPEV